MDQGAGNNVTVVDILVLLVPVALAFQDSIKHIVLFFNFDTHIYEYNKSHDKCFLRELTLCSTAQTYVSTQWLLSGHMSAQCVLCGHMSAQHALSRHFCWFPHPLRHT